MPIPDILMQLACLLDAHGEGEWANAFRGFLEEYHHEPEQVKGRIRSVYGGMGSFNDVILHRPDGMPMHDENTELAQLRTLLFVACE